MAEIVKEGYYAGRTRMALWVVAQDHSVRLLDCYSTCDQDWWWCPDAGFSGCLGTHIFSDERTALQAALNALDRRMEDLVLTRKKLEQRLRVL